MSPATSVQKTSVSGDRQQKPYQPPRSAGARGKEGQRPHRCRRAPALSSSGVNSPVYLDADAKPALPTVAQRFGGSIESSAMKGRQGFPGPRKGY